MPVCMCVGKGLIDTIWEVGGGSGALADGLLSCVTVGLIDSGGVSVQRDCGHSLMHCHSLAAPT